MTGAEPIAIALFPEWGTDVVLWPAMTYEELSYEELDLDESLVAALEAWRDSYFAGLDDHLHWRDATSEETFKEEGLRLGRLLAGELGDEFVIRIEGQDFRSRHPARNETAAAVLRAHDERERAELDELNRGKTRGAKFEWRAY